MKIISSIARALTFDISFDVSQDDLIQANKATDDLKTEVTGVSTEMDNAGSQATTMGSKIKSGFSNGLNTLQEYRMELGLAATATGGLIAKTVKDAADANEIINKFNVVFGEFASETKQWANQFSESIGRSRYATLEWLSSFQDVIKPMGFARDEAADLSKEMVSLAADLGSFNNIPTQKAASRLQSALVGNLEAVRSLGITISAADIKQKAYAEGIAQTGEELNQMQKMQARMSLFTERSSDAIGDAKRTSEDFNNQLQSLKGNFRDLSINLGKEFLPMANKLIINLNDMFSVTQNNNFAKFAALALSSTVILAGLGAIIGTVVTPLITLGGLFTSGGAIYVAFTWFSNVAIPWLTTSITMAASSLLSFTANIVTQTIPAIVSFGANMITSGVKALVSFATSMISATATAIPAMISGLITATTATWSFTAALLANPITWIVVSVAALAYGLYKLATNWKFVSQAATNFFDSVIQKITGFKDWVMTKIGAEGIMGMLLPSINPNIINKILDPIQSKFIAFKKWLFDLMPDSVADLLPDFNFGKFLSNTIQGGINLMPGWMQSFGKKIIGFFSGDDQAAKEANQQAVQKTNQTVNKTQNNRQESNKKEINLNVEINESDNGAMTAKKIREVLQQVIKEEQSAAGTT